MDTEYFAISCGGAPISIIRQYIEQQQTRMEKDAASPDAVADWQDGDATTWNTLLAGEYHTDHR